MEPATATPNLPCWAVPDGGVECFLNTLVGHSKATKKIYRAYLHMLEESSHAPLDLATFDELCSALNLFAERYSPSSYAVCKAALRGFLNYIEKPDLVDRIPNKGVRWLPKRGPIPKQIDMLLEAANFRERTLILVLYSTGIRVGELLGNHQAESPPARAEDIDWENGLLFFISKGGGKDYVPFFLRREQAMRTLQLWLNGRKRGPIFDLSASHAWRMLSNLGRRTGIKLTPHLLRHSTARSMRKGGCDLFEVNAQLRHRSICNTLAYDRAEPLDLIERAREREWR